MSVIILFSNRAVECNAATSVGTTRGALISCDFKNNKHCLKIGGNGKIDVWWTGNKTVSGYSNEALSAWSQATTTPLPGGWDYASFFISDDNNDTVGKGYINIPILLSSQELTYFAYAGILEYNIYSGWLVALHNSSNMTMRIAPNPATAAITNLIADNIETPCNLSFYSYYGNEYICSFNTTDFNGTMQIPSNYLARNGSYYLAYILNGVRGSVNFIISNTH